MKTQNFGEYNRDEANALVQALRANIEHINTNQITYTWLTEDVYELSFTGTVKMFREVWQFCEGFITCWRMIKGG